jgi:hypothetical protein
MSRTIQMVAIGGPADGEVLEIANSDRYVMVSSSDALDDDRRDVYICRKVWVGPRSGEEGPIFVMRVLLYADPPTFDPERGARLADLAHTTVRRVGMRAEAIRLASRRSAVA